MKLVDIDPTPNGAPSIKERCPHKVLVAGLTYDAPDPTISVGQSESFIPFTVYRNGAPIGNIDTEYNRQFNMDIGEQWTLKYQVFAGNSDPIPLALVMCRKTDGSVRVDLINGIH
jgi:hypothetical protein